MKDLLLIFIILLVLLIFISTLGGSINLPPTTIQAFTQSSPPVDANDNVPRPFMSSLPEYQMPSKLVKQEADALKIEAFDNSTNYAAI